MPSSIKIGILYICTGKYTVFWRDFYLSCEKNFIPEAEKHYFVFTNSPEIDFEKENKNVTKIYQENLGWPNNTLKRYDLFLRSKAKIECLDYLIFFNANLLFLGQISAEEFLPHGPEKLIGCLHPGYYDKPVKKYTYEDNPRSKAFLEKKEGQRYYAGGINGGETRSFLEAIDILNKNIEEDSRNKIVAKWHDESHWNWYLNHNLNIVKTLTPAYLFPEGASLPIQPKILIRDKRKLGGHAKLRDKIEIRLVVNSLKESFKKIISKLK